MFVSNLNMFVMRWVDGMEQHVFVLLPLRWVTATRSHSTVPESSSHHVPPQSREFMGAQYSMDMLSSLEMQLNIGYTSSDQLFAVSGCRYCEQSRKLCDIYTSPSLHSEQGQVDTAYETVSFTDM